ncbi:glycerol kinase GlpK [Catenulispora yoronensis]
MWAVTTSAAGVAGHIAAIDQGTTSSRCIVFDASGRPVAMAQREHRQIFPAPGWVEHDAAEIWRGVQHVVGEALGLAGLAPEHLAAVGITNQRETVVAWDRRTGQPLHNAIVWQDTRTDAACRALAADSPLGADRFRAKTGLPLATYFSGSKMAWLLANVDGLRAGAEAGDVIFGTMDSWLVWNLTGGPDGGVHVTDVTNASRTQLVDLATLAWDSELLEAFGVPERALPRIVSNSEIYGTARGVLAGVRVAGSLGDQQAALFGQACYVPGQAKSTYGTGTFLLMNTGETPVPSRHGLLTTVGYQVGDTPAVYALEGSVAVTGALIQWLRDSLGLIRDVSEVEALAASVPDNGGAYIVPAFSGLFAPHWRPDARGVITGLTAYVTKAHLVRAALEATAWQTREVVDAMRADAGLELTALKVDGGMTANALLLQLLADRLPAPVVRPAVSETTALGAAYAAGLAVGFWPGLEALAAQWAADAEFEPALDDGTREREHGMWLKAVERTLGWAE